MSRRSRLVSSPRLFPEFACACAVAVALCRPARSAAAAASNADAGRATAAASVERRRVRLDVSPPNSPIVPLLRAELTQLGLEVVEASSAERASIAVRIVVNPARLEVWITDESSGQMTLHEVFTQPGGAPIERRTAVLHAVELLRWYLRGGVSSPSSPRSAATPPSAAPPPRRAELGLRVTAHGFALYSPGGATVGMGGGLDLLGSYGSAGLRLLGSAALMPNRITGASGSASIRSRVVGLEAVWLMPSADHPIGGELGLGSVLLSTALDGGANEGFVGHRDTLLTVAPILDARLRLRLGDEVSLIAGTAVLVPLRSDRVRFVDADVGRYGQVLVTAGLGVQLALR